MATTAPTHTAGGKHGLSALTAEAEAILQKPPRSLWHDAWLRLQRNKAAMVSIGIILLLAVMAILAPVIAPHPPLEQNPNNSYRQAAWVSTGDPRTSGDWQWPLGTDSLGRDVLSRLVWGARVSLAVGLVPMAIEVIVGLTVGLIAGFGSARVDNWIMRGIDILLAFPDLLLFIIMTAALRETAFGQLFGGLILLFVVLSILGWGALARLVRGQSLSLREKEFIEASYAVGSPRSRIMFRHLMPNTLSPVIVFAAFAVPAAIIAEATLGYLGLGVRPATDPSSPFPTSWGTMLLDGQVSLSSQPYMLLGAAVFVSITLLAFSFLGDGLRDALDPRMKQ
ncbi:MAG: ABC transporter permease [Anaerolineae bacterium]